MIIDGVAAIATGGGPGPGGATAEMLARHGAKVAILDMNEEAGGARAAAIGRRFVRLDGAIRMAPR